MRREERAYRRNIKDRSSNDILKGIVLIFISLIFFISLFSYSNVDDSIFVASMNDDAKNILGDVGSYISDILVQFLGIMSFMLSILLFIWGINYISGRIYLIRYKLLIMSLYIFMGSIVMTVISSREFFASILLKFNINYYAGGMIGYILTKILFIDILRNSSLNVFVFSFICILWVFIIKKALFINFSAFRENAPKFINYFNKIIDILKIKHTKIQNKNNHNPEEDLSHWEDDLNTNIKDDNESHDDFSLSNNESFINNDKSNTVDDNNLDNKDDNNDSLYIDSVMKNAVIGSATYVLPSIDLLDKYQLKSSIYEDEEKLSSLSIELCNVLEEFGVKGEILNVKQGPVVTMFEFRPAPGIKTSRVISLSDDIARSMSAISARISLIPGQNAIGIELPNKSRQTVYLRELLSSEVFKKSNTGIPIVLGKDIAGNPILADLSKMPHLLVAGTTGSGKSVSINDMILSILFKFSPDECKLIMIDPKMLELSVYDEIPHLLTPVVTDPKKAVFALKWAVNEMENRYRQMSKLGVRNIDGFNKKLKESKEKGELLVRKVQTGFDQDTGRPIFETQQMDFESMPYIVVIVDEMADLMLVSGKDIESAVQRLAQMARAAGIHLIMATQRPSVDVITGTIKANFPTRISFQVTSKIDSRTILGEQGAEQLLGQGDMLYMAGGGRIMRVHGPFVKDIEVERIVSYIKTQKEPSYVDIVVDQSSDNIFGLDNSDKNQVDELFEEAKEIILRDKKVSISYIQRKLQIGYNRAARIIEQMEEQGIISAPNHTGKREIIFS